MLTLPAEPGTPTSPEEPGEYRSLQPVALEDTKISCFFFLFLFFVVMASKCLFLRCCPLNMSALHVCSHMCACTHLSQGCVYGVGFLSALFITYF